MFALIKEDFSGVGGPMHSASSKFMWSKHFNDLENAKAYAELDFNLAIADKDESTRQNLLARFDWVDKNEYFFSGDLMFCGYYIRVIKAEDDEEIFNIYVMDQGVYGSIVVAASSEAEARSFMEKEMTYSEHERVDMLSFTANRKGLIWANFGDT